MSAPLLEHRAAGVLNAVMCFALGLGCLVMGGYSLLDLSKRVLTIPSGQLMHAFTHTSVLTTDLNGVSSFVLAACLFGIGDRLFRAATRRESDNPQTLYP